MDQPVIVFAGVVVTLVLFLVVFVARLIKGLENDLEQAHKRNRQLKAENERLKAEPAVRPRVPPTAWPTPVRTSRYSGHVAKQPAGKLPPRARR